MFQEVDCLLAVRFFCTTVHSWYTVPTWQTSFQFLWLCHYIWDHPASLILSKHKAALYSKITFLIQLAQYCIFEDSSISIRWRSFQSSGAVSGHSKDPRNENPTKLTGLYSTSRTTWNFTSTEISVLQLAGCFSGIQADNVQGWVKRSTLNYANYLCKLKLGLAVCSVTQSGGSWVLPVKGKRETGNHRNAFEQQSMFCVTRK